MRFLEKDCTLAIILGASKWPVSNLNGGTGFSNSAAGMKRYVLSKDGLNLSIPYVLDLFDSEISAAEQLKEISLFLNRQIGATGNDRRPITDVLIYYVGHGSFLESSTEFFMAVRNADIRYDTECLMARSLGRRVRTDAPTTRQFIILDCCFSGAAARSWQGTAVSEVAIRSAAEAIPDSGAVFLCSSAEDLVSMAPAGAEYTMFTGALLTALRTGVPTLSGDLSARRTRDLVWEIMKRDHGAKEAIRPVVFGLDRGNGDISELPAFPNPGGSTLAQTTKKEREQARKIGRAVSPQRMSTKIKDIWRAWFEPEEVILSVVLSEWFDPEAERISKITARVILDVDNERHWIAISNKRAYVIFDQLYLVEPLVDWSFDLRPEYRDLAKIPLSLVSEEENEATIKLGDRVFRVGHDILKRREADAVRRLGSVPRVHKWLTSRLGEDRPSKQRAGQTKSDLDALRQIRHYIYDQSLELGASLVRRIQTDISETAASWVMYLVRMHRRDPRLTEPEVFHLTPLLQALCGRRQDQLAHRYHAQLAYLLWCDKPADYDERVMLLTEAIALRERSDDKGRYPRYELTRATSVIRSDEGFNKRKRRRSSTEVVKRVVRDLKVAESLIYRERVNDASMQDIKNWCKLNEVPIPE